MASAQEHDGQVTLGVELEFLATMPWSTEDIWKIPEEKVLWNRTHARHALSQDLANAGLPTVTICRHSGHKAEHCCVCQHNNKGKSSQQGSRQVGLYLPQGTNIDPQNASMLEADFNTVDEEILGARDLFGKDWQGLEIASAVFTSQTMAKILPVFDVINTRDHVINDSCGMHIHAGFTDGLSHLEAKKIVTVVALVEGCFIRQILPADRLDSLFIDTISTESNLSSEAHRAALFEGAQAASSSSIPVTDEMRAHLPQVVLEMRKKGWNKNIGHLQLKNLIKSIWNTNNMYELARGILIKGGNMRGGAAICLRLPHKRVILRNPLRDDIPYKTPSSIEFRYPPMKADKDHFKLWIELVETIMHFGKMTDTVYSQRLGRLVSVLNGCSAIGQSWTHVLGELGLGERIEAWKAHKRGDH
ncbi:uncharacterized protein J7T54_005810 [Emericellopsis cladophorae]|uniref:Uncharacterized protein n=1 Tax=Emericellopsis cladophorae TaxID=2686198 RepID=A0A9P9XUU7_9HYPO|nr:uncharacterized protein J7T54_005810 [Emericellopsis cladophorae]KAI6778023.1 hypothetical protein J7T54_005810 [Emericellopsis cladophorae]